MLQRFKMMIRQIENELQRSCITTFILLSAPPHSAGNHQNSSESEGYSRHHGTCW